MSNSAKQSVRQGISLFALMATGAAVFLADVLRGDTVRDFDTPSGTPFALDNCVPTNPGAAPPQEMAGGPGSSTNFMRLASTTPPLPISNSMTFDLSDSGAYDQIVADFDFRITAGPGRGDGFGFAVLKTALAPHGISGPICPFNGPYAPEEPMFTDSIGVGFDIYQNAADPAINHPGDINSNHISVHFDRGLLCSADATPVVDLAGGEWVHAQIAIVLAGGPPAITVTITPPGGSPVAVIDSCAIPDLIPYESRVFFGARSGGASADHDLDNIEVAFSGSSNMPPTADAGPNQSVNPSVTVSLTGSGDDPEGSPVTFLWQQTGGPLVTLSNSTVAEPTFTAPAAAAELMFELVTNDGISDSTPDTVRVTVASPDVIGQWGEVEDSEVVPVHAHLLPNGQVLYWEEGGYPGEDPVLILGEIRLLDPASGSITEPAHPPFDLFCAGHSFLADGGLLVTGGHDQADGVGLPHAAIYGPAGDFWMQAADMGPLGEGRWYPTNTTLPSGDVLVLSGSKDTAFTENTLPQVWEAQTDTWRDLTDAEDSTSSLPEADHPLGSRFVIYPRMFVTPDGRVFKADANPNQMTWFLDTTGLGAWTEGPMTTFAGEPGNALGGSRDYGTAVYYAAGQVMITGGGDPPTASTEVIDLTAATPTWRSIAPMAYPRRHLNATILADGTVLVVGGTSSPDFNNAAEAVLEGELWDPASETWSIAASMQKARVYHSVALLLRDGRVLAGGGGRPGPVGDVDQVNFEIFSPPYLFKGPRPVIFSAPEEVTYGQSFYVEVDDAAAIAEARWIRLGSVTHAFDQNQRSLNLSLTATAGGVRVSAPADANLAPPGHYMLLVLNAFGVPSVSSVVRISACPTTLELHNQVLSKSRSYAAVERISLEAVTIPSGVHVELRASETAIGNDVVVEEGGGLAVHTASTCS